MASSSQAPNRLDYLDAARALALLLGIFFHASLSFMPMFIGWAVMDISTSNIVAIFVMINHSFRMELFFLIAGFFSHMTLQKKGMKAFISSRLIRIGLPLVVGWFLLRPMLVSGWVMGAESMRGDVNVLNGLSQGIASFKELPNGFLIGTHLWFLYYLLLIPALVLVVCSMVSLNDKVKHTLSASMDHVVTWLCRSSFAPFLVMLPIASCLWFMSHWGMDTPDKSLIPNWPVLFIYTGFFSFGWLMNRQRQPLADFATITWGKVFLCLLASILSVLLTNYQSQLGHPDYLLLKIGFTLSYALMMWTLVSLFIGLCFRFFNRLNHTMRYLADASYWLYLIHLPIVIWLQIAFAEVDIHWAFKLLSICMITVMLSLILYELFVRSTVIGAVLNGRKKSRVLISALKSSA
ncbi:acyltransferase family protein [Thalassotalea hakodatensis]|uniref:acyltransferase family protein n=1 Tax=Thalassotalea hakodatensis TaxID=3030492 RepID=UPI0025734803|nr:acyltransferase family protein [Thalassotalea hakodatensis]